MQTGVAAHVRRGWVLSTVDVLGETRPAPTNNIDTISFTAEGAENAENGLLEKMESWCDER